MNIGKEIKIYTVEPVEWPKEVTHDDRKVATPVPEAQPRAVPEPANAPGT